MAAAVVVGGVLFGTIGALVSLATGGTLLAAAISYIVFGQAAVVMLISGVALCGPFPPRS